MRLRRSGTRKILASFSNIGSQFPVSSQAAAHCVNVPLTWHENRLLHDLDLAAGLRDLLFSRLRELVRLHRQSAAYIARAQYLDQRFFATDQPRFAQHVERDI